MSEKRDGCKYDGCDQVRIFCRGRRRGASGLAQREVGGEGPSTVHSQKTGEGQCGQDAIAWEANAGDLQTVCFPERLGGGTGSSADLDWRRDNARNLALEGTGAGEEA